MVFEKRHRWHYYFGKNEASFEFSPRASRSMSLKVVVVVVVVVVGTHSKNLKFELIVTQQRWRI